MPGSFTLKPIEANLTHNTVFIGSMSPYCEFCLGDATVNSAISKKGGKKPHWDDVVTLPIPRDKNTMLHLAVLDKETLIKDDHIGCLELDLKDIKKSGPVSKWYPLFYNERPAGEILLEAAYIGKNAIPKPLPFKNKKDVTETAVKGLETEHKIYSEQRQVVEPHTFSKEIDVVEIVPITQRVEVMEPITVQKDIEYTDLVKVVKSVEIIEPHLVTKQIAIIEPRIVTIEIQVVENYTVWRDIEVIESESVIREVETYEPQTVHKQVEVTEYVPVTKEFKVTEPIHVKKAVDYSEPVITTQTITKEIREPVIINEETKITVGPATVIDVGHTTVEDKLTQEMIKKERLYEEKMIKEKLSKKGIFKEEEAVEVTAVQEEIPTEVVVKEEEPVEVTTVQEEIPAEVAVETYVTKKNSI